jgi:hypothetical protein
VAAVAVLAGVGAFVFQRQASVALGVATAARSQAIKEQKKAQDNEEIAKAATVVAKTQLKRVEMLQYASQIGSAHRELESGNMPRAKEFLDAARWDYRGWEHAFLASALPLTLKGHTDLVLSVSFSPDGERIVSGSVDKTLKVWDAETGQETLTLKGHALPVLSVSFRADRQRQL